MYGMVQNGIRELALQVGGETAWAEIVRSAGSDPSFIGMSSYPDEQTYALIGAATEVLGLSSAQILRAFGHFWLKYTAQEGYGEILSMAGSSLAEFLDNLDSLHARIGLSMPELAPPSFRVEEIDASTLLVTYASDREGLAEMVYGLLEALAERFDTKVDITQVAHRSKMGSDQFHVKMLNV